MRLRTTVMIVLVLTGVSAVLTVVLWQLQTRAGRSGPPVAAASDARTGDAAPRREAVGVDADPLAVLRAWDARRAAAYAHGDPAALRRLYAPGSRTGAHDRAVLASYLDRGLRVAGMTTQVLAVSVTSQGDGRIGLVVTDRLARAVAVGAGTRMVLPRDSASTRAVGFHHRAGRWVVEEVRALPQASAVASTSRTPGSRNS